MADVVDDGDGFYIHIADPGFPDPPWPGFRRLGPFLTQAEALAQAAGDAAQGMGVATAIYTGTDSEAIAQPLQPVGADDPDAVTPPTPVYDTQAIASAGDTEAAARAEIRDTAVNEMLSSFPDGAALTADDLRDMGIHV